MDEWKEVKEGFDKWLKITCYLGFVWVFVDILPYLPPYLVDRIIDAFFAKLGV